MCKPSYWSWVVSYVDPETWFARIIERKASPSPGLSKLVMHPWKLIWVSLKNEIPSGKDRVQIQSQQQKSQPRFLCIIYIINYRWLYIYTHIITYRYKYLRNDSIICYLLQGLLDYELAHCGPLVSQSSSWLMVDGWAAGQVPTAIWCRTMTLPHTLGLGWVILGAKKKLSNGFVWLWQKVVGCMKA